MNEQPLVDLDLELKKLERQLMAEALFRTGGLKIQAAKQLGITFRSFRYRFEKHFGQGPWGDK